MIAVRVTPFMAAAIPAAFLAGWATVAAIEGVEPVGEQRGDDVAAALREGRGAVEPAERAGPASRVEREAESAERAGVPLP